MFSECPKNVRSSAKGQVEHHPEIEPEDMLKLYSSIDINTPTGLQEKVWLDVMLHFIRRGRENQRSMTVQTFEVGTDASGKRFVSQRSGEIDKNHGALDEIASDGRIYETGTTSCPVESFIKYVDHLHPQQTAFWQKPKQNWSVMDEIWYSNSPIGKKTLGGMLAKLSIKYVLSQRYTNHSLRVTGLQALEDANIEGRHIIRVSGHKSEDSILSTMLVTCQQQESEIYPQYYQVRSPIVPAKRTCHHEKSNKRSWMWKPMHVLL